MKLALFSALSLILCSCAGTQHVAPRFVQPSTVPIQKAQAATHVSIQKAQQIVKTLTITLPPDQTKIDALSQALNDAQVSNDEIEGARAALETQLASQTQQANTLADNYDKSLLQITGLQASLKHVVSKLHLAKWIMCGLVLAVAAFVAVEVPMLGMYGAAAIAVSGCAAVWMFL